MQQRRGNQSSAIGQFLNPTDGHRGALVKKGLKPKDHMKDNRIELRQEQARKREEREEAARPKKDLFKLQQFKDVRSRLHENYNRNSNHHDRNQYDDEFHDEEDYKESSHKEFVQRGVAERRREELKAKNLAARDELDAKMEDAKYYADRPTTPRKAGIYKGVQKTAAPSNTDFLARNKAQAMHMEPIRKHSAPEEQKHENYGRVPSYLKERKQEWEEQREEEIRRRPDPSCPPGMCLMPEGERQNTLDVLMESRKDAMAQLQQMPFVVETLRLKKKQDALENKLREIEQAITIFSKPKVYVALNR